MAPASPKRFYETVSLAEEPGGYAILLDGRMVKTPGRHPLLLPNARLADAVAEEWRAQDATIRVDTMPMTKFAYTAIDRIPPNRAAVIEQIVGYGSTDLLCYRAATPSDLVARQSEHWDPLLDWARETLGAALCTGEGIIYVEQPESARLALEQTVSEVGAFELAGLHTVVSLLGSLVVGLALLRGRLDVDAAFAAAHLDETYQAEFWGEDWEARERSERRARELAEAARYLQLLRAGPPA